MMTIPNLAAIPWLKLTFPDMLWLCSILSTNDDEMGPRICSGTLDIVENSLRQSNQPDTDGLPFLLDGRLTSFELVPSEIRSDILHELQIRGVYKDVVPEGFAHALGLYPTAPGRWLLGPWLEAGIRIDWEAGQKFLTSVLANSSHGQDRISTMAKAVVVARFIKSGKLLFTRDSGFPFDLLPKYPNMLTIDEREMVDASIRATFLTLSQLPDNRDSDRGSFWASSFWRSNWSLYPCSTSDDTPGEPTDIQDVRRESAHYYRLVRDLYESFLTTARQIDPDIFEPDRYEVLTGLTSRSIRLAAIASAAPSLWSGEHGFFVIRSIVETKIVLRWLLKQNDITLYRKFKEYGVGRQKLLKLHLEDYIDSLEDPPAPLIEHVELLNQLVNQDIGEEWQNISIESTFSGKSIRDMAREIGMDHEYKFLFAPASSATHGEWTAIDGFVLERCLNPLHLGHRIPRETLATPISSGVMDSIAGLVEGIVSDYESSTRPRPEPDN